MTHPNREVAARKVLAKIAATDPYFAKPSQAIVKAWSEQFAATNLTDEELLDGVTALYAVKESGFRPLPADVLNAAKRLRREAFDRLPLAQQEAIRAAETAATDAELFELEAVTPPPTLAHRLPDNPAKGPRWVRCPYCGAYPGNRCYNRGRPELVLAGYHPARAEACKPTVAPDLLGKAAGGES